MVETGCSLKVVLGGDPHEDRILSGEVFLELRIEFNLSMFQNGWIFCTTLKPTAPLFRTLYSKIGIC